MKVRTSSIDLGTSNGITELEQLVQLRLGGHLRDFQLVIANGSLILRGWTPTYYAKQLVQHVVMQKTDFPILANEIQVV